MYVWLTIVTDKVQLSTLFICVPLCDLRPKSDAHRQLYTGHSVERSVVMVLVFIATHFTC